jgi:hypothetical protein
MSTPTGSSVPAFRLTVSTVSHDQFAVTDRGSAPLAISSHVAALQSGSHGCGLAPAPTGITVRPASFRLAPGHTTLTAVHVPAGTPAGSYAVIYSAAAPGAGSLHVAGGVGARLNVGGAAPAHCGTVAAPAHTAGGLDSLQYAGGGAMALALVGLAALAVRARRRGRRHTTQ